MKVSMEDLSNNARIYIKDEGFDVPGWVTIEMADTEGDTHIKDLYFAVKALYEKYKEEREQ